MRPDFSKIEYKPRAPRSQPAGPAEDAPVWNAAEHIHQFLPGCWVVAFVLIGHALNHSRGSIRFDEAGRSRDDPNSLWTNFIGQAFAIVCQCCLRRRVGES